MASWWVFDEGQIISMAFLRWWKAYPNCRLDRYIYGDLFGIMWAAAERPAYSGNYTVSSLPFTCTPNSPIKCNITSSGLQIGMIISYGEDNNADFYVLATTGLYRLVSPSHCNITCTATLALTPNSAPAGSNADPSFLSTLQNGILYVALALVALVWSWDLNIQL